MAPGKASRVGSLPSTSVAASTSAATTGWSASISTAGTIRCQRSSARSSGSSAMASARNRPMSAFIISSVMPGSVRTSQANSALPG